MPLEVLGRTRATLTEAARTDLAQPERAREPLNLRSLQSLGRVLSGIPFEDNHRAGDWGLQLSPRTRNSS
jgi:hypothetical protein